MTPNPIQRAAGALALLLVPTMLSATMVRELTLPELVARADRIVRGRCLDVREATDPRSGLPVTEITFAVAETVKGPETARLVFRQLGDRSHPGPGPSFAVGEDALLFLGREGPTGLTAPIGLEQGRMPIRSTATGAATITVPATVAEIAPLDVTGRRGRRCTVDVDRFIGAVRDMISR